MKSKPTLFVVIRSRLAAATLLLGAACVFCHCGFTRDNKEEQQRIGKQAHQAERNPVDTIILRRTTFMSQLVSNGKLRAATKSSLRFPATGSVTELRVKNGDRIEAGDIIAVLDTQAVQLKLEQARSQLGKAEIQLLDALLDLGYTAEERARIPSETMRIARIRSGYEDAILNERTARSELQNCTLRAPVGGKVADLKTSLYEYPPTGDFCKILDDSSFDVEFPILETELSQVRMGQGVLIATFTDPDKRYSGQITEINPLVDDKGQVVVKARFRNPGGFIDGMNVKVFVENGTPGKLVVPKNAVLIRDNLEVLFLYGEGGRAVWTYVHVLMTNSTSCAVVANEERGATLKEGDAVIISGNLNLADGSNVEIK